MDDTIVDGTQTVTITATAAGHTDATDTLGVTDNDAAELTLNIAAAAISENGGTTTAAVSRNTDTTGPLTVMLFSSDDAEAAVPASVEISTGQTTSAPFAITGVDDTIVDGTQTVTITATAAGLTVGTSTLEVTDNDKNSGGAGNVDGDADFDANDSFLIHLVMLGGTDAQIDLVKGASPKTAAEIRAAVNAPTILDGDGDTDANDSFLVHLVQLGGTEQHINALKGGSPLTATQILANVEALGVTQSASSAGVSAALPETAPPSAVTSAAAISNADRRELFAGDSTDDRADMMPHSDGTGTVTDAVIAEFRRWIDQI